jgi:succinate dehydrogenase/fumarate reductase flavoprotein subunit
MKRTVLFYPIVLMLCVMSVEVDGITGANRLGGNGVADIVVNGRLAGISAATRADLLK